MKKDLGIIFGLFLLIIVLLIFGRGFTTGVFLRPSATSGGQLQPTKGVVTITAKGLTIEVQVAQKPSERKVGLSKKDSLPLNAGMLFVFEEPGKYGIWMKDMKFAIDIIWINEEKKIVDIASNVAPEPAKKDKELTIYRPQAAAKYILEISAGLARLNNIQIGDQVNFEL